MSTWQRVAVLAEEQWGLFTRQQADQRGMAWSTLSRMVATGRAERVGHGVYRLRGSEPPSQVALRVAWLELAPSVPAWDRDAEQGVVSHRSAALLFGLGDLPADVHEFTLPVRRQTRRDDVRLHRGDVATGVVSRGGLLSTDPSRTVVDLLTDGADPAAESTIVAEPWTRATTDPPHLPTAFRPWRIVTGSPGMTVWGCWAGCSILPGRPIATGGSLRPVRGCRSRERGPRSLPRPGPSGRC